MKSITRLRVEFMVAVSLAGLSTGAMAQDWMSGPVPNRGLYIEGTGGATWTDDFDSQSGPFPPALQGLGFGPGPHNFQSSYSTGWAAGGRVGYGFRGGLRVEGEAIYRYNDLDSVDISPAPVPGVTAGESDGEIESVSLMANVLYDWQNTSRFTPYIGAGGGALWVKQQLTVPLANAGLGTAATYEVDSDSWVPAVQGIAGVNIALTPAIGLSVDYRYLHGFDASTDNNLGVSTDNDYSNHTVFVALRYTFGAPPVPPPIAPIAQPAPPAPAPQVYLIFFDFDRADLSAEGRDVVNQVAARARQPDTGVQQIQVSGYTDRAGPPQYNQRLSQRRAETVRRALIEQGVPANEITTRAFGEENPRVPTPDGVREPQNRRVEIVFI